MTNRPPIPSAGFTADELTARLHAANVIGDSNAEHSALVIANYVMSLPSLADRAQVPTREEIARCIHEARHAGLKNCWAWDDSGLDDEHPGAREMCYFVADAILALLKGGKP